jgi:hypothetical protein
MKRLRNRIALRKLTPAVLLGCAALAAAAPASAATLQVAGVQSAPLSSSDPCFDPSALTSYSIAGGLVGCWYTDTLVIHPAQPSGTLSGTIQATGTEHFVGCLDLDGDGACTTGDPSGTLQFSYQFSGKFDPLTGAEIHGRCQHPITSGTGDFAGASGVITFKDDATNGTSLYGGHLGY